MTEPVLASASTSPRWTGLPWGQWLVTALFAVFLLYLADNLTTPSALLSRLARPQWDWLAVAVVAQAASFGLYGGLYKHGFRAVGVPASARRLVGIVLASIFVKTVVPLAGAAAMSVFVDDASSRGHSGSRAAAGMILVTAIDLLVAVPLVGAGMLVLAGRGHLAFYDIAGTLLFVGFIALLVAGLIATGAYPSLMRSLLNAARVAANRIAAWARRPAPISDAWVHRHAGQFAAAAAEVPGHPRDIAIAGAIGVVLRLLSVGVVFALFLALGRSPGLGVVLAGLGAATVFFVVTIVPDGIGAVEGAMALTFVNLGVDPATAILVTLGYRVLTIWVPVALGFFVARQMRLFGGSGALAGIRRDRPPDPFAA